MSKREEVYGFEIPEGYDWVAVDGDGEVAAFKEKPYLGDESSVWLTYNTGMTYILGFPSGNQSIDFKNSLVYVPDLHPKQSNFLVVTMSFWTGFLTLAFSIYYVDTSYETLEQRKQTIESKCSDANNSTPESFDKSSVTCKNGAVISYSID